MGRHLNSRAASRPSLRPWTLGFLVLAACIISATSASAFARVQGRLVATDSGEPIGFADLLLIPADTTMRKVGGLSNADGTFLLVAAPGRYDFQIRALSYARKRIEGLVLEDGQLLPFNTTLEPEAIQQEEIVVEATSKQNSEASMLAARRKATSVGDAVSAEQMRRAPDRSAGDVLRRVTGLSVSEGKYVFVRGLGERYSSTEVDGVRIASPEQNKRVVPMDLFPAALLENIVVQKTYTADRSGEFGGGDVQVSTKDFPGKRSWSFSASQGFEPGTTFHDRLSYGSTSANVFGFGSASRGIPSIVNQIASGRPLAQGNGLGFPVSTLQQVEKAFANVWTPSGTRTLPNGSFSATFGDERTLFGRPLGFVQAWSLSRSIEHRTESERDFKDAYGTIKDDYQVERYTESVQLGGNGALSYRFSPSHRVHLRGFYTNSADDEVRTYEGPDEDQDLRFRRSTRLMYVQRDILSGTLEGQHDLRSLLNAGLNWKFTRSLARRQQPDRRETMYVRMPVDEADPGTWGLAVGRREYGDLRDNGWGTQLKASFPWRLASLGNGRLTTGYDRQTKARDNFYRRFDFIPSTPGQSAPPESLFDVVNEATLAVDNYRAQQRIEAVYVSTDLPFGRRLRGNLGMRREAAHMEVVSHDLFDPTLITSHGRLDNVDWLLGTNVTWSPSDAINLRGAMSHTVARPDLDELSPSPTLDHVGAFQRLGNPNLRRATMENYDLRLEAFPALGELFAAGVFLKRMHDPIEYTIRGASGGLVAVPENSSDGRNLGLELEARASLGHLHPGLKRLSLNANVSFISSKVRLKDSATRIGSQEHPLQGQANYLMNSALSYQAPGGRSELTLLLSVIGKRLVTLSNSSDGIPDHYDPGIATLDATVALTPFRGGRVKLGAGNLLDRRIQELVGPYEAKGYRNGRSYSVALSYGS